MSELVSEVISDVHLESAPQTPTDCQASAVVAEILKLSHRLRATLAEHFSEFGLSDIRFSVLKIVRDAQNLGCTQARLADELSQSESSISTLIDRMRGSNLLYRLRSPYDRRKRALMLTDHGQQLLDDAEQNHGERMVTLLSCFDDEQLQEFRSLLKRLHARLETVETPDRQPEQRQTDTPDETARAA